MQILVVDDEAPIRELLSFNLKKSGYEVEMAADGRTALQKAPEADLVLLDIMLPEVDGLEVCRQLKADPQTSGIPIIMLTARSEDADKIIGLESGADDYITKPFNILELKARIRALLRRANAAPQQKQPETLLLTAGGITLDPEQRVAVKNGEIVELTAKEYDLIELLVKNPRRVYSRENLMDPSGATPTQATTARGCAHPAASRKARGKPRRAAAHPDQMGRGVLLEGLISH